MAQDIIPIVSPFVTRLDEKLQRRDRNEEERWSRGRNDPGDIRMSGNEDKKRKAV